MLTKQPFQKQSTMHTNAKKAFYRDIKKNKGSRYVWMFSADLRAFLIESWGNPDTARDEKRKKKIEKIISDEEPLMSYFLHQAVAHDVYEHDPSLFIDFINRLSWKHHTYGEPAMEAILSATESSQLPEAALLAVQAAGHINAAWSWRGNGYASTVTNEGWAGFRRHLQLGA